MGTINETLKSLPPEAKQVVAEFVEFLAQKYLKKKPKIVSSKEKILNFAGVWKDMDENDFQDFLSDVYGRREKSFKRRRKI
jgi:hypothetical protein